MYKIKSKKELPNCQVELEIVIDKETINSKWKHAIKHLNEHANIDGFRKGHIPENILVSKIGELTVVEEAIEIALDEIYPKVIIETKLSPIGQPKIVITKIAKNEDVEITVTASTLPKVSLSDYKKISSKINKKKDEIEVLDKEIEDVLEEIKKYRAKKDDKELTSVEIDDEFVKTLGDFKDLKDFKEKVKENLVKEKTLKAKEKKRIEIMEEILKESLIEIPEILIQYELDQMEHEFSHELSRIGGTLEKYLKDTNKKIEEIKNDWKEKAEKRVKGEIVLIEISKKENIKPEASQIEHEVKHLQEHYPNSPKERLVAFVEDSLTKEEVFKFLETQA